MAIALALIASACANPFGREYEYEEQMYLNVDGSADVIVDSSLPALVALRGLPIDPSPRARVDTLALRRLYESLGCTVRGVGQPWFRHGRRFVQVRLATSDVRTLQHCAPLGWSRYTLTRSATEIDFKQIVGPAAGGSPGDVNWTGAELIAFRLHLPSKILYQNVRRLSDNSAGDTERGNILTWEQRLADRRAGAPVDIEVHLDPESILYRTLWLFAGSFVAAVMFLGALIAWTIRKGKKRLTVPPAAGPGYASRPPRS